MAYSNPYHGRKGLTDVSMIPIVDGVKQSPIVLAAPSEATLNKGISLTEIMTTSQFGEMVLADSYTNENKPTLALTFPVFTPQTVALREGVKLETSEDPYPTWVIRSPFLVTGQIYEAATTGQEGFGVTANPTGAKASYLDEDGISQPITITGTFSPTTPPVGTATMAIGANLAMSFSSDLVGKYISLYCPNQLAGIIRLSESPEDTFEINLTGVTRALQPWHLKIYSAVLKQDTGDYNLAAEQALSLEYSIVNQGAGCRLYEFQWLPQVRKCLHGEAVAA